MTSDPETVNQAGTTPRTVGWFSADRADAGALAVGLGGALVLVAYLFIPALVDGDGGSRTGHQIAVSIGRPDLVGLFWLQPVAATILVLLGMRSTTSPTRTRLAGFTITVAGFAALGLVATLKLLQRPEGAAALFQTGIDPASAIGPAYWLCLAGLVAAIAGGVSELTTRPVVAGAATGIVVGTIVASVILDIHQNATRHGVVALAAEVTGEATFGPDFAAERAALAPDHGHNGRVAGNNELLYAGTPGRPSCDRDALAEFVAASATRSSTWLRAATADSPGQLPADVRRYIAELTPVRLRADIRVTAYRFLADHPVPYQATLQAGTAVLVDGRGIPRVRCAGTTPLAPPREASGGADYLGPRWSGFDPAALVTVTPAPDGVRQFGLTNDGHAFRRPAGTNGNRDVDQVPAQAVIDGIYLLNGKQTACMLSSCTRDTTRAVHVTVRDCPDRCLISGDDWSGTQALTESSGTWRASGTVTAPYSCDKTPVPTTFTLVLRVTAGEVIDGVWTATQLQGTYGKNSPLTASCSAGAQAWDISAARN
jgi:hypothetical protein